MTPGTLLAFDTHTCSLVGGTVGVGPSLTPVGTSVAVTTTGLGTLGDLRDALTARLTQVVGGAIIRLQNIANGGTW
jgi:hypothetical protein